MKTLLAAVAVLVASVASAQVAVTTPDPINVDPQQARALAAVCASAYSQASGQPVATPTTAEQLAALPPGERVELQLIGLDGARQRRVLVRAQRKTADGRVEHEAMLEALSLEDAPTVCERLAVALVNKQSVEDTQTRKNVTAAEAMANRRRRVGSNKSFGVKTGFTGAVAQDVVVAPMGSLLFDARIEGERFFTQLGAGFLIPAVTGGATGYGGLTLDMGAGYYLVDGDFAPYLGLGVQPRLVFSGSVFNLVPYVQLGFTTSRKAGVRFNVEARVGQNVLPALNGFGLTGGTLPTEFTLNLGLGF
ncbi:MAG: hypothetical protein ACOZQL_03145 [Myxococcota bacterium]